MAAARLTLSAFSLLNRAFASSGKSQRDLAHTIGVGESLISQVLHGDGNIRLFTFARHLRTMGYRVALDATPAEVDVVPLPQRLSGPRRSRYTARAKVYHEVVEHDGVLRDRLTISPFPMPKEATVIRQVKMGSVDYRTPAPAGPWQNSPVNELAGAL